MRDILPKQSLENVEVCNKLKKKNSE
jgi:hypothetical protein